MTYGPPIERPSCRAGHPMMLTRTRPVSAHRYVYIYACTQCHVTVIVSEIAS